MIRIILNRRKSLFTFTQPPDRRQATEDSNLQCHGGNFPLAMGDFRRSQAICHWQLIGISCDFQHVQGFWMVSGDIMTKSGGKVAAAFPTIRDTSMTLGSVGIETHFCRYVGVSIGGGTPKCMVYQKIIRLYKMDDLGVPHFRKPPCVLITYLATCSLVSRQPGKKLLQWSAREIQCLDIIQWRYLHLWLDG